MRRLFVAILFPPAISSRLTGLMGGVPGAHWTAAENLHLTLRFIGEVDDGQLTDIDAALGQISLSPFPLILSGIGTFGSGRALRLLWAGVDDSPALMVLHSRIDAAVAKAGLPADSRRFSPHVTLARLTKGCNAERVGRFVSERGLFLTPPFTVSGFALMESHLGRQGPNYGIVNRYGTWVDGDAWQDDGDAPTGSVWTDRNGLDE